MELMGLKVLMCMKSASKDCVICHYWHFFDNGLKFQPNATAAMIYN